MSKRTTLEQVNHTIIAGQRLTEGDKVMKGPSDGATAAAQLFTEGIIASGRAGINPEDSVPLQSDSYDAHF